MRKATLSVGRGFEIGTEPVPQPGPGEARVQVRACGVCQTEVHAIDGSLARPDIPGMMGHEFSGEVVALGADVTGLEIGMPVACLARGGYSEQVVVPVDRLFPLPAGVPVEYGAFVEPLACIVAAVESAALPMGATALLTGAGPMGLLTLQLAHRSRAARVIVSDPDPDRRALALRLGAVQAVDPRDGQVEAAVMAATGGDGVAVAFESAGVPAALADCLQAAANGGRVVMIGVHPSEARLSLHLDDFHPRNLSLVGVYGGRGRVPAAAQWLAHLDIEPLIGRRYELADINTAFDVARSGQGLKVLVGPGLGSGEE